MKGCIGLCTRSVLDGLLAVGMEDRGGKAVLVHDGLRGKERVYGSTGSGLISAQFIEADGAGHADVQALGNEPSMEILTVDRGRASGGACPRLRRP